jgi:hypothetical protein
MSESLKEAKDEKAVIKDLDYIIEFSKDPLLKEIILDFNKVYPEFSNKVVTERNFSKPEESSEHLKQYLFNFLNDIYQNIKYKISEFQKNGLEVNEIRIKSMSIPLKIKIFKANFSKKDFDLVIRLIDNAEKDIKIVDEKLKIDEEIKKQEEIKKDELTKKNTMENERIKELQKQEDEKRKDELKSKLNPSKDIKKSEEKTNDKTEPLLKN